MSFSLATTTAKLNNKMILPASMRCIVYGGKQGLQSIAVPIPKPSRHTVLVRVYYAGLNPVDTKDVVGDKMPHSWRTCRSWVQSYIANKIPGFDFSGTVVAISQDHSFQIGDEVFGTMPPFQGTLAEYLAVPLDQVCFMPTNNYSFAQAAALPLVGLTALQCLQPVVQHSGSSVLIVGASGGTGHVACQVARNLHAAHVTAICSDSNADFVLANGATHVVDYHNQHSLLVVSKLQAAPGCPYSVVLDCVTSADPADQAMKYPSMLQDANNKLLAANYVYRRLGGASPDWIRAGLERKTGLSCWKTRYEKLFWIRFPDTAHELRQLQEWAEAGKLTPHVAREYEFSATGVRDAFDAILSRHQKGKVVVRVYKKNEEEETADR